MLRRCATRLVKLNSQFDWIVVGAGPAGCAAAARLAQLHPEQSIALVDAGAQHVPYSVLKWPLLSSLLLCSGKFDFVPKIKDCTTRLDARACDVEVAVEENPTEAKGKKGADKKTAVDQTQKVRNERRNAPVTLGRGFGGSTNLGGMIYCRGHPSDYSSLGWSFERDVEPVFTQLERSDWAGGRKVRGADGLGTAGVMPVRSQPKAALHSDVTAAFFDAMQSLGYHESNSLGCCSYDGGDGKQDTIGAAPGLSGECYGGFRVMRGEDGHRVNAFDGFCDSGLLEPGQKNVSLRPNATVTRLILEKEKDTQGGKSSFVKANGVVWRHSSASSSGNTSGKTEHMLAKRGVVLALGALQTPALLLRSGIGEVSADTQLSPPKHVNEQNTNGSDDGSASQGTLLRIAGVGCNLIDHPMIAIGTAIRDARARHMSFSHGNLMQLVESARQFRQSGDGPMAAVRKGGALVCCQSDDKPDTLLQVSEFADYFNQSSETFEDHFTIKLSYLYPSSRGRVSLAPNNTLDVDLNLLSNDAPGDLMAMEDCVELGTNMSDFNSGLLSSTHKGINGDPYHPFKPLRGFCKHPSTGTAIAENRKELLRFLKQRVEPSHNFHGTCAYGTVVDESLAVLGTRGLFIGDSSVFPDPVGAPLIGPSMLVGWRCAELASRAVLGTEQGERVTNR